MLLDKFQYLLGDTGVGTDIAAIHLPVAQLFHLCILGWHDANSDLIPTLTMSDRRLPNRGERWT